MVVGRDGESLHGELVFDGVSVWGDEKVWGSEEGDEGCPTACMY